MREFWIIVQREFRERVRTRSFLIGTLLFPVFMAAVFLMPAVMGDSGKERRIAIVDRAPAGVADVFVRALEAAGMPEPDSLAAGAEGVEALVQATAGPPYVLERPPTDVSTEELNARVLAEELTGYVILPPDLLETGEVLYRARNITDRFVLRDLRVAANAAVQTNRLGTAGLDPRAIRQLMDPVTLQTARITEGGQEGGDAQSTFFAAYILAFLVYFMIAMYGHAVMRSVIQEKVTRISEILVSTVRAMHLMAGKIVGVSAAALLQVAIWAALILLAASQSALLQDRVGISPSTMDALRIDPAIAAVLALFFVLGFLIYSALFAGLGAAMSTEEEAQPYQMMLMVPLFVPLLFLGPITSDPDGGISTFLGLFPLTAPVAMPMRLASAPPEPLVIATSLGVLLLSTAIGAWIAGKIYRVGILATGQKPSVRELVRWIRAA